jgi:hypothetical protein
MELQQISRVGGVAGGSGGNGSAVVAADWRAVEAFPRRLLWPTLLGSLMAGVGVAILANTLLRPDFPTTAGNDPAAVAPLGLLASPTTTGGSRTWSARGAGAEPSEGDRVEITDVEGGSEVFVPVPESAIGPPQPTGRMPL